MSLRRYIAMGGFCGLGLLGFQRGTHSYKYELKRLNTRYNTKENFFYFEYLMNGVFGTIMYMLPPMWFVVGHREIYRLEVNLRNLEDEKQTDMYNRLM